MDWWIDIDRFR